MKSAYVNLVRFLSVLSLSSLVFLTVSAQTDGTNPTVPGKTNSNDVLAIEWLVNSQFAYVSKKEDPCLPKPYPWLKCSSENTPRITEINLPFSFRLGGNLQDFSPMDALEKINLSNNYYLGYGKEFPDFLANFPKLKVLNLVGTPYSGTVPTSLKKRSDNKTLTLMLPETGLCFSDEAVCPPQTGTSPGTDEDTSTSSFNPPLKSRKKKTTPVVLGTLIPILVIFSAIVGFLIRNHQKRKAAAPAGLNTHN